MPNYRYPYRVLVIIVIIITLVKPDAFTFNEFPVFRVVIDPGHGGQCLKPMKVHGDRYDPISGTYLSVYNEGAAYRKIYEHAVVYSIAEKVKKVLDLCASDGDFDKFSEILKKYTDDKPIRIVIQSSLSRGDSSNIKDIIKRDDPNAEFRLFDYPDKENRIMPGRISRINALKPHLVVSLHFTTTCPPGYTGMNPVIVPPYSTLEDGLNYLKDGKNKKFFYNSPYNDWFSEARTKDGFDWFLKDASVYFTGYPVEKNKKIKLNEFKGYKYNMLAWAYKDDNGWKETAKTHPVDSQYSVSYSEYKPSGRFWDRDRSQFERYRRADGEEGYGGDNLYASSEIIRYILSSLYLANQHHPSQKLAKPYISTWILPTYLNAITAYIELGYINLKRHRYVMLNKQEEMAEGIAAGIYSLFAGLKPKSMKFKYSPKGKKIDLQKYNITNDDSYFDSVVAK